MAERVASSLANVNVAVSPFTADRLPTRIGAPVQVIANGVDTKTILQSRPHPETVDILFVGRLMPHKGLDLLLDAVRLLSADGKQLRVSIVGDGPELPRVQAAAAAFPAHVSLEIQRDIEADADVYGRMKSAKVLALPSRQEGYGLVVAEAQACGAVPVVIRSPHSGATSLIEDGRTGLICDPEPSDLARAISSVLRSGARRCSLRAQALRASSERGWSSTAASTAQLYRALLGS